MVKDEVDEDIADLIAGLEIRLRKAEGEVKSVKGMIREIKKEIAEGEEENRGVEKPKRKKHTWKVGDRVMVKNSFRYRGSGVNIHRMKGRVTKVARDWIWFEVHAMCTRDIRLEQKWEGGYYRKRWNLENVEWELNE